MSPAAFRRALVLANPIAGRGRARGAAEELVAGLAQVGIECELHFTSARGDAMRRARSIEPGFDLAVSVGGDGTVGEVLEGLSGRDLPVAILPIGTANVMSLDLGIPRDVPEAVRVIARGKTTALDTARVNAKRLSFLVTSVGFDAAAVHEVEARRRGPITRFDYFTAGLRALWRYEPRRLAVEIDGRELPGRFALVLASNVVHYGGLKVLAADRRIDDGLFEVYLFAKGSRASLLGYGIRALVSGLPGGSCTRLRARSIRITSDAPAPCQVDGDAFGETPVEIVVDPVQSRLVVP
ncbi:MAG: diacylglycerol/lipid kinase family protein [Planctomycetota bacterium]